MKKYILVALVLMITMQVLADERVDVTIFDAHKEATVKDVTVHAEKGAPIDVGTYRLSLSCDTTNDTCVVSAEIREHDCDTVIMAPMLEMKKDSDRPASVTVVIKDGEEVISQVGLIVSFSTS